MRFLSTLIFITLLLSGCSQNKEQTNEAEQAQAGLKYNSSEESRSMDASQEVKSSEPIQAPSGVTPQADKKIIRNATVRIQVKDHNQSVGNIEKTIQQQGAYLASSNVQNTNDAIQSNLIIRIKSDKFDPLLDLLMKEAIYIDYKNVNAEDVTTQFIDTEARLKAKKEVEKRYMELLKQAKKVEEIIQIEAQLGLIREEIEAKEGVLKYLNDQVAFSTINLEIYERIEGQTQPEDGFFRKISKGIQKGWYLLLDFIVGVFYLWPFLILAGIIVFIIKRRKRK